MVYGGGKTLIARITPPLAIPTDAAAPGPQYIAETGPTMIVRRGPGRPANPHPMGKIIHPALREEPGLAGNSRVLRPPVNPPQTDYLPSWVRSDCSAARNL